jgi:hypothetical protein
MDIDEPSSLCDDLSLRIPLNEQKQMSKIHTCPIHEETDIAYETPNKEDLEKYYSEFMNMSSDQLNMLLNIFTQRKGMNLTEKTFHTVNPKASNFLSERLKQKQEELKQKSMSNEQLSNEQSSNEQLSNEQSSNEQSSNEQLSNEQSSNE